MPQRTMKFDMPFSLRIDLEALRARSRNAVDEQRDWRCHILPLSVVQITLNPVIFDAHARKHVMCCALIRVRVSRRPDEPFLGSGLL
jgi:hypothetical protein